MVISVKLFATHFGHNCDTILSGDAVFTFLHLNDIELKKTKNIYTEDGYPHLQVECLEGNFTELNGQQFYDYGQFWKT